jgi:sterol O-acyltransferase
MAITTFLRNLKDTGYPMRIQIWRLFTVKFWELGVADGLMVASTSLSLPLQRAFQQNTLGFGWSTGGMLIQAVYQTMWFSFWVA